MVLPPRVADDALAAVRLLEPTGATLLQAAAAFLSTWTAKNSSCVFSVAVNQYLCARDDLRETTLKSYCYTLQKVFSLLASSNLAEISTAELQECLKGKGGTSVRMHRRNLSAFWKWACSAPRSWGNMSIVAALEGPRISNDSDIEILKPADVKALLHAAEEEGPSAAAAYAIAVFGGVRMEELKKLKWGNVGEEFIEIGKAVAKKHSRRLVPLCASLKVWLDVTRGNAETNTPIVPPNWIDISKSVRRRAGWDVAARLLTDQVKSGKLKAMPEVTRGKWPANSCRHTCASVQVAIGTPLEDLTFKFGHSGGHDLLRAHYVSRLTKKDAMAILSIGPDGMQVPNLQAS